MMSRRFVSGQKSRAAKERAIQNRTETLIDLRIRRLKIGSLLCRRSEPTANAGRDLEEESKNTPEDQKRNYQAGADNYEDQHGHKDRHYYRPNCKDVFGNAGDPV